MTLRLRGSNQVPKQGERLLDRFGRVVEYQGFLSQENKVVVTIGGKYHTLPVDHLPWLEVCDED